MKPPLQFSHIFRRGLALLLAVLLLTAHPQMETRTSADDGDELPSEVEFFLASDGSDANDGSPEAPFATLSHAAEVASGTDAGCVILILLTDLVSEETASFSGGSFILTSDDAICTISRGDGLRDPDSEAPLIAVGDAGRYAEDGTTAELVLEYVVLDDSEGSASSGAAVEVSDGAKLVVGDDASIYARDGKAAVQGDPEAEICVGAGGEIIGDTPFQAEEGCTVNVDDGAAVPGYAPSEDEPEEDLEDAPQNEPQDEPEDEPQDEPEDEPQGEPGDSEGVRSTDASGTPEVAGDAGIPAPPADEAAPGDDDHAGGTAENPDNPTPLADETAPGDDDSVGGTAENPEANTVEGSELNENTGSLLGANRILSAGSPMLAAAAPLAAPNVPDGFSLSAPVSISKDDEEIDILTYVSSSTSSVIGYSIPYVIAFRIPDFLANLAQGGALALRAMSVRITLTLPESVLPEVAVSDSITGIHVEKNFSIFNVTTSSFEGMTVTLNLDQSEDWSSHLSDLTNSLRLTVQTVLPKNSFPADNLPKTLTAEATIDNITYTTFNSDSPQSLSYSSSSTAETLLLGDKTVELVYDPLDGIGGPGTVMCSKQDAYPLETNDVPAHDPVDGTNVVFVGWSETEDQTIYDLNGELPPGEIVETVDLTTSGGCRFKDGLCRLWV